MAGSIHHHRRARIPEGWLTTTAIPPEFDIRETVPDFESRADAVEETEVRKALLRRSSDEEQPIRRMLRRCSRHACKSPACAKCHREFAVLFTSQSIAVLRQFD